MAVVYHRTLYEIAKEISSSLDSGEVLNAIVQSVTEAMAAKGCSLMLLSPDESQLTHTVAYGLSDSYIRKGPVRLDASIAEGLKGNAVWVPDIATDPRVQYLEQAKKEGIASMLSVPIKLRDRVIGVLRVYFSEPHTLPDEAIEFLSAASSLGAMALEKARLYESRGKELEEISAQLKKLEDERARFLRFFSIAAHDLKAPLAAIQSYLGVLLGGYAGELAPKQRNMMERSSQRVVELLRLISDLLDISRIEIGQLVEELKETPLEPVIAGSLEVAQELARSRDIKLVTDVPGSLPAIYASAPRLQQVLSNLLSNAVNYSTVGGQVVFRLRVEPKEVRIEVSDEGIGIPPEDQPRIFEEFFRASNVESRQGTGLGLSIAGRIVEAHGGRIWAESPCPDTGKGSRFTFVLPRERPAVGRQPERVTGA